MDMVYSCGTAVMPSVCAADGRMSVTGAVSLMMDAATKHAEELGFGLRAMMEKGLFWVASRTMVEFFRMPELCEEITVKTWPIVPGSIRTERQYHLSGKDGTIAAGKTVWAIIDVNTGRPVKLDGIMDPSLPYCTDAPCSASFPRISYSEGEYEDLGGHRVTSQDIDMGRHMNNTMYLRALFSCFSVGELEAKPVRSLCVEYLSSCYEGELLSFRIRREEGYSDVAAVKEDGKPAALFRLTYAE